MKAIRILPASALRRVALSLALLGAGLAFTQAGQAETVAAADRPLMAADGTRVDAGTPGGSHRQGHRHGRAPFADLQLTDAQRDKLFELRHAQAPARRAQMKELRGARTELRTLAMSDRFDESRAAALTERAAKAQATLALLNARNTNEFYKLLTPEQRQKLEASRSQRRGGERGGFHGRHG